MERIEYRTKNQRAAERFLREDEATIKRRMEFQLTHHPRGQMRSAPPWTPMTGLFVSRMTFLPCTQANHHAPFWLTQLAWFVLVAEYNKAQATSSHACGV